MKEVTVRLAYYLSITLIKVEDNKMPLGIFTVYMIVYKYAASTFEKFHKIW